MNRLLWTLQTLMALLFLFAGAMKFIMPAQQMADQTHLSVGFLHFIGAAEVLGGLGLVLPRLLKIRPWLTPLAAAGLVIIMIGATVVMAKAGPVTSALFPLAVGIICGFIAYGRWRIVP
jgi:uncharacterized membrane protein YphA (DoxX/SURF4 family)